MIHSVTIRLTASNKENLGRNPNASVGATPTKPDLGVIFYATWTLPDRARTKCFSRIEAAVNYMMQRIGQPMQVSDLSARLGISDSQFHLLFKVATGATPVDFLIRARMHIAAALLKKTDLQIKQVGMLLGYDDQFYFSRLFKSVHGQPPNHYRHQIDAVPHWLPTAAAQPVPPDEISLGRDSSAYQWRVSLAKSSANLPF